MHAKWHAIMHVLVFACMHTSRFGRAVMSACGLVCSVMYHGVSVCGSIMSAHIQVCLLVCVYVSLHLHSSLSAGVQVCPFDRLPHDVSLYANVYDRKTG